MRKIPKTLNLEMDLLIYIEKKGKELGLRKESVVLNQIIREYKDKEEENPIPKEQSKINTKAIEKINDDYKQSKEFLELKAIHPKGMRDALKEARSKIKTVAGFEKKHKKAIEYLKKRDYKAVQILKRKLKQKNKEIK